MSKKQDFIRSEQSRDKHPERAQAGSAAGKTDKLVRAQAKGNPADHQQPGTGKVVNDHNKVGATEPTQKNEGERTPESRHDRENLAGSHNQVTARKGGGGAGRSPRGAG
jgi:hypothetical protein